MSNQPRKTLKSMRPCNRVAEFIRLRPLLRDKALQASSRQYLYGSIVTFGKHWKKLPRHALTQDNAFRERKKPHAAKMRKKAGEKGIG